jgi:hypothetical protein
LRALLLPLLLLLLMLLLLTLLQHGERRQVAPPKSVTPRPSNRHERLLKHPQRSYGSSGRRNSCNSCNSCNSRRRIA